VHHRLWLLAFPMRTGGGCRTVDREISRFPRKERLPSSQLGGTAAAWPLAASAQQPERVRRIGVLMSVAEGNSEGQSWVAEFVQRLDTLRGPYGQQGTPSIMASLYEVIS
jgi:hypothetical protein